ncbi:MAG: hypothetical protein HYV41_02085 [Candidatus Magasanikbacteria bacterium]|nr:hypothetical protein [Candidatus Magasanikbacteria bacterium]
MAQSQNSSISDDLDTLATDIEEVKKEERVLEQDLQDKVDIEKVQQSIHEN